MEFAKLIYIAEADDISYTSIDDLLSAYGTGIKVGVYELKETGTAKVAFVTDKSKKASK